MNGARAIAACVLAASTALAPFAHAGPAPLLAAAASLREVVRDATAAHPGWDTTVGGSAALARQIERGAPVALYLSASRDDVDALERHGRVVPGSTRVLATNTLVLIAPPDSPAPTGLAALVAPGVGRVALANPRTAPAGRYAESALRTAELHDRVRPRAVYGENVRQVLEYVARGDADLGVVYGSDVHAFPDRVTVGATVPAHLHPPIEITGAIVSESRHEDEAGALLDWLASPEGQTTLERHGFRPQPRPK